MPELTAARKKKLQKKPATQLALFGEMGDTDAYE